MDGAAQPWKVADLNRESEFNMEIRIYKIYNTYKKYKKYKNKIKAVYRCVKLTEESCEIPLLIVDSKKWPR